MVKAVVEWSKRWSNGQGGSQVVKGQAVTAVQASGVPAAGRPSRTASFDQRSKNRTATFDHWSNALTAERSSRSATAAGRAGALRAAPPPPCPAIHQTNEQRFFFVFTGFKKRKRPWKGPFDLDQAAGSGG